MLTRWILLPVVAIPLLLIGVVARRRRLSRMREASASSAADRLRDLVPKAPQEMKTSPDPQGEEMLEHLRGLEARGAPGLAAQVIEMFVRDTSTRLAALREAIARRDGEATYRVAHTLQGSAAMAGAASVARSCAELTSAARDGSFDRCEAIVAELDTSFKAIQRVVIG